MHSVQSGTSADSVKGEGSGGGAPKKKFTIRKIRKDKKKESSISVGGHGEAWHWFI